MVFLEHYEMLNSRNHSSKNLKKICVKPNGSPTHFRTRGVWYLGELIFKIISNTELTPSYEVYFYKEKEQCPGDDAQFSFSQELVDRTLEILHKKENTESH